MKSVVSERGQVTIPKPLRDRLGLGPGQVLEFEEVDGRLVATKILPSDAIDDLYGKFDLGRSTDEIVADLRGD